MEFRRVSDKLEVHEALPTANFKENFSSNQSATQYRILLSRMGFILQLINTPSSFFSSQNWVCFHLVSLITATVFSPMILESDVEYLQQCIEKFLRCYSELYGGHFPNKFHHLIHLPRSILLHGPLSFVAAMPFERKLADIHPQIKSRKNVILQIVNAFKHQMTIYLTELESSNMPEFSKISSLGILLTAAKLKKNYKHLTKYEHLLPDNCKVYLSIREHGSFFSNSLVVNMCVPETNWLSNLKPISLWEILVVYSVRNTLFLLMKKLEVVKLCSEILAYEVKDSSNPLYDTIECKYLRSKTFSCHIINNKKYVFVDSLPIKRF